MSSAEVQARERLNSQGLKPLSRDELNEVSRSYGLQLVRGIARGGNGLPMISTALGPLDLGTLREGSEALVIEIGGTNAYAGRVRFEEGELIIAKVCERPLGRTKFNDRLDFFTTIADRVVEPLVSGWQPDAMGIVYSFPGKAFSTENAVDILSPEELPKGFEIPGISKDPVGQTFLDYLSGRYNLGIRRDLPLVVSNDTSAVLLAGGGKVGGVVGTGFNLAVVSSGEIINTESGSFDGVPTHKYAVEVDNISDNTGEHLAEKQISGKYLGETLDSVVMDLRMMELLKVDPDRELDSEALSAILSKNWEQLRVYGVDEVAKEDQVTLREIAGTLRQRSASLVGTMLGTLMTTFREEFPEDRIAIPIEGSFFWGVPSYMQYAEYYVRPHTPGKMTGFVNIQNAGLKGAAAAALSRVR